jgi:mRNA interferase MazF
LSDNSVYFQSKNIGLCFKKSLLRQKYLCGDQPNKSRKRKDFQTKMNDVRRGDIFYADLSPVVGSEQGGLRPVLIIQNDIGNRYSPTVIAAAITSRMGKTRLPTHIDIYAQRAGLAKDSVVLLEQVRTLDKRRLKERMGHLDLGVMERINDAIAVSFGISQAPRIATGADYSDSDLPVVSPAASVVEAVSATASVTEADRAQSAAGQIYLEEKSL